MSQYHTPRCSELSSWPVASQRMCQDERSSRTFMASAAHLCVVNTNWSCSRWQLSPLLVFIMTVTGGCRTSNVALLDFGDRCNISPLPHLPHREENAGDTCSSHFPFKLCARPGRLLTCGFCVKSSLDCGWQWRTHLKAVSAAGRAAGGLGMPWPPRTPGGERLDLGCSSTPNLGQSSGS